jgi:hypothetical protein
LFRGEYKGLRAGVISLPAECFAVVVRIAVQLLHVAGGMCGVLVEVPR